jgi:hypothetical protein
MYRPCWVDQSRLRRHRHEQPSFCFNHFGWRQLDGIHRPRPRGNAHIQPDVHGHWEYDGFLRGRDHGRRTSTKTFSGGERSVSWEDTNIITFPPITLQNLPNARLVIGGISIPSTMRITSDPSCAAGRTTAVICGVRGSDSALYISQFNGARFSPFQFEGGTLAGAPSCAFAVCAVRGANSELFVIQPGITTVFTPVPGTNINGDPSCTLHPNQVLTLLMLCGVRSTDSTLWITIGHP